MQTSLTRVLIVDEDRDTADCIASLLQPMGRFDARIACAAESALEIAKDFLPAVVLLDIDLPDREGERVARALRQHPQLRNLRLVALTHDGDHADRGAALAAGFERYLNKPVMQAALEKVLNDLPVRDPEPVVVKPEEAGVLADSATALSRQWHPEQSPQREP